MVARCIVCYGQYFSCECADANDAIADTWSGEWPGVAECRERGWYAVLRPGQGWVRASADTEGASEDLNRWLVFKMTGKDGA